MGFLGRLALLLVLVVLIAVVAALMVSAMAWIDGMIWDVDFRPRRERPMARRDKAGRQEGQRLRPRFRVGLLLRQEDTRDHRPHSHNEQDEP